MALKASAVVSSAAPQQRNSKVTGSFSSLTVSVLAASVVLTDSAGLVSSALEPQAAFHLTVCTRPKTLILDEPVDGLDPVMRRQVMGLILSDVAGHGTTVLISSHNLRELEDVCDYVGIMNRGKMLLEKSLADMQGSTVKLQLVGDAPQELDILNATVSGRLKTLIVRGEAEEVGAKIAACKPAYFDVLPLSLEEIFIYELGGVDYEIKDILL